VLSRALPRHSGISRELSVAGEGRTNAHTGYNDLGWMLHDIDHDHGSTPRFFRAEMVDGLVQVPPWQSEELKS